MKFEKDNNTFRVNGKAYLSKTSAMNAAQEEAVRKVLDNYDCGYINSIRRLTGNLAVAREAIQEGINAANEADMFFTEEVTS